MQFILDVHCHTVASGHAYSTISENVAHAASIGLSLTGISDHGPQMPGGAHLYHFGNITVLPNEIDGVRLLKGAEVNILDRDGNLDLPTQVLQQLDFSIASLHGGIFDYPNNKAYCTEAVINAMRHPYMHILGHPGDPHFPLDMEAVVKAAKETYSILEINNHSLEPDSWRFGGSDALLEMLALCQKLRVPVLASSDAHIDTSVGRLELAKDLIESSGIDEELVLNTSVDLFLNALKLKRRSL